MLQTISFPLQSIQIMINSFILMNNFFCVSFQVSILRKWITSLTNPNSLHNSIRKMKHRKILQLLGIILNYKNLMDRLCEIGAMWNVYLIYGMDDNKVAGIGWIFMLCSETAEKFWDKKDGDVKDYEMNNWILLIWSETKSCGGLSYKFQNYRE